MITLAVRMPKKKETLRTEIHLMPDKYKELKALAEKANRSIKNYAETVILEHLENVKEQSKKKSNNS